MWGIPLSYLQLFFSNFRFHVFVLFLFPVWFANGCSCYLIYSDKTQIESCSCKCTFHIFALIDSTLWFLFLKCSLLLFSTIIFFYSTNIIFNYCLYSNCFTNFIYYLNMNVNNLKANVSNIYLLLCVTLSVTYNKHIVCLWTFLNSKISYKISSVLSAYLR